MDKYLSAKDGITIIIFLFFISFLWATSIPAAKAAPEEIPIGNPSIFAAILAVANAVSFAIWIKKLDRSFMLNADHPKKDSSAA